MCELLSKILYFALHHLTFCSVRLLNLLYNVTVLCLCTQESIVKLTLDIVMHTAAFVSHIIVNISNSLLVAVFLQTNLHLYF
jgi:hypothetical protein